MADLRERIVIDAVDNTTKGFRSAQNKLNAFDRTAKRLQTTLLGFVGVNIFGNMVISLAKASDSAIELEAKLRLMTDGTEDYNVAQDELVKISLQTGTSLEANTVLFTRMNNAVKALGGNTQTTLGITKLMAQGLRISGASAQESSSVIRQYSQAMSSGVLRGEEFNAIMENGGRIAVALAKGLGVPIGSLREMATQGLLTAKTVNDALLSQADTINNEASQLPITMGRAIENINTKWTLFLQNNKESNSLIAEGIQFVSDNFEILQKIITTGTIAGAMLLLEKHLDSIRQKSALLAEQEQLRATQSKITAIQELKNANDKAINDTAEIARKKELSLLTSQLAILKDKSAKAEKLSAVEKKQAQVDELLGKQQENVAVAELTVNTKKLAFEEQKRSFANVEYSLKRQQGLIRANNLLVQANQTNKASLITDLEKAEAQHRIARNNIQRATATRKIAEAQTALNVLAVEEQTLATKSQLLASKAISLNSELLVVKKGLTTATTELAGAEGKLADATTTLASTQTKLAGAVKLANKATFSSTAVINKHTSAISNNVIAQNVWLKAKQAGILTDGLALASATKLNIAQKVSTTTQTIASGVTSRLRIGVGLLGKTFTKLTSALLGPVGMFAYIGYEIGKFLGVLPDFGLAFKAIEKHAQDAWIGFKNFFGIIGDDTAKIALDKNNQHFSEWSNKRIADAEAVKAGFKDSAEQIDKLTQNQMALEQKATAEAKAQLEERSKDRATSLTALQTNLDAELDAVKYGLQQQAIAEEEHKTEILRIGNEFTEQKISEDEANNNKRILSENELQAKLVAVEVEYTQKKFDAKTASLKAELDDLNVFYGKRLSDLNANNSKLLQNNITSYEQQKIELDAKLASDIEAEKIASEERLDNTEGWFSKRRSVDYKGLNNLTKLNEYYESALTKLKNSSERGREITTKNHKKKLLKIERKNAKAVKKVANSMVTHLRTQLNAMRDEYADYVDKSENVLSDLQDFERTTFGDKRTEYQKTSDALAEASKINADLRQADILDQQGKTKESTELREKALQELKDLIIQQKERADSAEKGSLAQVQADRIAKQGMTDLTIGIGKLKKGYDDMTDSLAGHIKASEDAVADYIKLVDEADQKLNKVKNAQITTNADEANAELQSIINKLAEIKDKTVTVTTKHVTEKAGGGLIEPAKYADGGFIPRTDRVPGSGDQDTVKALLTPGEFVLKKSSVAKYGYDYLRALNSGNAEPAQYANGGAVRKFAFGGKVDEETKNSTDQFQFFRDSILGEVVDKAKAFRGSGDYNKQVTSNWLTDMIPILKASLPSIDYNGLKEVSDYISKIVRYFTMSDSIRRDTDVSQYRTNRDFLNIVLGDDSVKYFNKGGQAKGGGVGDSIKALLTPGEFVMKKSAVQKFGSDFFNSVNAGVLPQKFANGGLVSGNGSTCEVINVNFNMNGKTATGQFPKNDATTTLLQSLKQAGASA